MITRGIGEAMSHYPAMREWVVERILDFVGGDWGDSPLSEQAENSVVVANEQAAPVRGVYELPTGLRHVAPVGAYRPVVWIISEADRSATTVLWPTEA